MGATQQVYRLRDIVTEEVSLVDRAANKRTFLITKRARMGQEVTPDGKGGFTAVANVEPELAPPAPAPAATEQPSTLAFALTKASKTSVLESLTKGIADLTSIANAVQAATEADADDGTVSALVNKVRVELSCAPAVQKYDRVTIGKAVGVAMQKLTEVAAMLGIDDVEDSRYKIYEALNALMSVAYDEKTLGDMGLVFTTGPLDPEPAAKSAPDAPKAEFDRVATAVEASIKDALGAEPTAAEKRLSEIASTLKKNAAALVDRERALAIRESALKTAPVRSNASGVETDTLPAAKPIDWPRDMNKDYTGEAYKF